MSQRPIRQMVEPTAPLYQNHASDLALASKGITYRARKPTSSDAKASMSKRNSMFNVGTSSKPIIHPAAANAPIISINGPYMQNFNSAEYLNMFYRLLNTYNVGFNGAQFTNLLNKHVQDEESLKSLKQKQKRSVNHGSVYYNSGSFVQSQAFVSSSVTASAAAAAISAMYTAKSSLPLPAPPPKEKHTMPKNLYSVHHGKESLTKRSFNSASHPAIYDVPSTPSQPRGVQPIDIGIRFAVNGLSKFARATSSTPSNRSIQAGDFGDDSGMIAENSRCIVIGLADGAGGNRSIGIDPQVFSRSLLGYCVDIVRNDDLHSNQMTKLACKSIQILESKNIQGSGTLCLLGINKQTNVMHSMNIGDSGFRLIRNGEIVHKSEATMSGSSPRQLYVSEASTYSNISFINEEEIRQDSDIREFMVQKGDLIVLSSDGMFDVMTDSTILKVVNKNIDKDLQTIADELLLQSMRSYIYTQRDDILVMVCRVEVNKP